MPKWWGRELQDIDHARLNLTAEAQGYLNGGSPEAQVFAAVPQGGCSLADLKVLLCDVELAPLEQQAWYHVMSQWIEE